MKPTHEAPAMAESPLVQVEGAVERVVYESEETGFFVARLRPEGHQELITFVGNLMAVSPGETIRLWGRWVDDKKFGRQLRVERYETVLPGTAAAIEKYLGSGLIDGIGPKYAERLVKAFGVETLKVIDEHPERLRRVQGIGRKRAAQIREAWQSQKAIQSIMLFLQGHGISVGQAVRIYKCYGDAAVAVLRENPYRLAEDIAGIAFRSADKIAAQLGITPESPVRAEAGLLYALQQAASRGHSFLTREELLAQASELLGVDTAHLEQPLVSLVARQAAVCDGERLYPTHLYAAEIGCEQLIKRLVSTPKDNVPIKVERAIAWVEKAKQIELSEEQRDAIRMAVEAKVMVITGGPGTGKTTLINSLIAIFEKKALNIQLAAPTGRAAKRMEAATDHEARTIHRLLEFSPKRGGFLKDENNPVIADLIIIDESSMLDVQLMHSLLKAVPPYARVFFVGDVDQLPSVGPGTVLMDLIASGTVPVAWLKTIFRQAEQSGIVKNAHRINRGDYPEFNTEDFFFVERKDPARALETVVELVTHRIPRKFGLDPKTEVQVIAPMHRGEAGVARLNEELQASLNPGGAAVPRKNFRVGDKVMQLRNNYELDVYNGDTGLIRMLDEETKEIQVRFDDREVLYHFDDLDELALAYAMTVHKSQGSEYPAVVLPILPQHYMLLQRNLLYTAVTRGKQLVILVGAPRAVGMAIGNNDIVHRNTCLAERLRNALGPV